MPRLSHKAKDPPHIVAMRRANAPRLRDLVYGVAMAEFDTTNPGKYENVMPCATKQAFLWAWIFANFCGTLRFTYEELWQDARAWGLTHPETYAPAKDYAVLQRYRKHLWDRTNAENRNGIMDRLPGQVRLRSGGRRQRAGRGTIRKAVREAEMVARRAAKAAT